MKTCAECQNAFQPKQKNARFCSIRCRRRNQRASSEREVTCATCDATFTSRRPDAKYCSPACRNPDAKRCSHDDCERPALAKGVCGMHWNQQYRKRIKQLVACAVCGTETEKLTEHNRRSVCSDLCRRHLRYGGWPSCPIPEMHAAHGRWSNSLLPALRVGVPRWLKAPMPTSSPLRRRWYSGQCQRCSEWFVFDQPANRYCSARCSHGDSRDRRRARKREAFVAPVHRRRIFERDGWRCRLCGKKVKRDAVAPHPLAPVLDHIIPLAKGGTHEPANVQCAHFLCNSRKSDGGEGEQLLLIG